MNTTGLLTKEKIEEMEQAQRVTALTCYTDGSTAPGNPGPSGWGFYGLDNLSCAYSAYGPVGISVSNNVAELTAILRCIQYADTHPHLRTLQIYSDSKYAVEGIKYLHKRESQGWITSTGQPVANAELLREIQQAISKFLETKDVLNIDWVRGHNGNVGNEMADTNANKGRLIVMQNSDVTVCDIIPFTPTEKEAEPEPIEPKIKGKKVAIAPLIPLLNGKRWFFYTNLPTRLDDGRSIYTSSSYKDDAKLNHQNCGKRSPDTSYSILVTDQAIPELDSLREAMNASYDSMIVPVIAELTNITKATIWVDLATNLNKNVKIKGVLATAPDSSVLATVISPPKLIFKLENIHSYGLTILDHYERGTDFIQQYDITDSIFTQAKNKQVINAEFIQGLKLITVKKVKVSDDITTNVKLVIGTDIPLRNNFSAMLRHTKQPIKVTLVVFEVAERSYRVATVVEYDNHKGIYYSPDSNYRIVS